MLLKYLKQSILLCVLAIFTDGFANQTVPMAKTSSSRAKVQLRRRAAELLRGKAQALSLGKRLQAWSKEHRRGLIAGGVCAASVGLALGASFLGLKIGVGNIMVPAPVIGGISVTEDFISADAVQVPGPLECAVYRPYITPGVLQPDDNSPLVLNLGGNGSKNCHYWRLHRSLAQRTCCPVIGIDYPGVGASRGFAWSAEHCAEAIVDQFQRVKAQNGWGHRPVVVIGHSLGGCVGTLVAKQLRCAVFVDRSFRSAAIVGRRMTGVPLPIVKLGLFLAGWELNLQRILEEHAHSGHLCVVANHPDDEVMTYYRQPEFDARVLPNSSTQLILLELGPGGGHNESPEDLNVATIEPKRTLLMDGYPNRTLEDAMVAFIMRQCAQHSSAVRADS